MPADQLDDRTTVHPGAVEQPQRALALEQAVVEGERDPEPREQSQRRRVGGQHGRLEAAYAVRGSHRGDGVEQRGPEPAALVGVGDLEGDLGRLRTDPDVAAMPAGCPSTVAFQETVDRATARAR